jgi:hypothetical protein
MEMMIAEPIQTLEYLRDSGVFPFNSKKEGMLYTAESIDVAIDAVRKYQKIEQIYQKWIEVYDFSYEQAMSQIGVVLKDGKID